MVYYSLYGQLLDINNLYKGFKKVKSAKGAAGIDRQSINAFALDLETNLKQLQLELQTKQYRAQPVKRVEIPKVAMMLSVKPRCLFVNISLNG